MELEFDPKKSESNERKHEIDFIAAQAIWEDSDAVQIPARDLDEPRSLVIGKIGDKHWSAVITPRERRVRIISVRRSRPEEIEIYESPGV